MGERRDERLEKREEKGCDEKERRGGAAAGERGERPSPRDGRRARLSV